MNWHILIAAVLWIFVAGTMGWNRMFRGYCLQSLGYLKTEVLPQLQGNIEWKKEAIDIEENAIPQIENYITDSSLVILPLTCALAFNTVLFLYTFADVPVLGFLNGLMAFGNASAAVWISISRIRYFKTHAHVNACYTLLHAEELHKKSLEELENEEKGEEE